MDSLRPTSSSHHEPYTQNVRPVTNKREVDVLEIFKGIAILFLDMAGLSNITKWHKMRFVNFAMKRPMNIPGEKEIHKSYDGDIPYFNLKNKCNLAKAFLKSDNTLSDVEKKDLERIIAHRENMLDLKLKMVNPFNFMGKILRSRVDALSDPQSNKVTHFEDGSSSFSIPGGSGNHYVTYEIQRKKINDKEEYFFVIHNRGSGRNKATFHGKSKVKGENGLEYMRTSVSIKVDKSKLTSAFFSRLNRAGRANSIDKAYELIQKDLLKNGDEILKSDLEKEYEELPEDNPRKAELGQRLIKEDPSFHSVQSYGTCTESNRTAPEEKMASASLRKKLKLFTLQSITNDACRSWFSSQNEKKMMKDVFKKRAKHLNAKITGQ